MATNRLAELMDEVVVGYVDGKPITAGNLTVAVFEAIENAIEDGDLAIDTDNYLRRVRKH